MRIRARPDPDGGLRTVRIRHDRSLPLVIRAAVAAGLLSGAPSTAHALVTGRSVLAATRAAGTLLGRSTVVRGLAAHLALTASWATLLAVTLPRRRTVAWGAISGLAIGAVDLGIGRRRWPAIDALPTVPQLIDHLAFGTLIGAVLGCHSGGRGIHGARGDHAAMPDIIRCVGREEPAPVSGAGS